MEALELSNPNTSKPQNPQNPTLISGVIIIMNVLNMETSIELTE